jgi:hemerythrin
METKYFIWKDIFETGISEIDIQNKKIFKLINDLYIEINGEKNFDKINVMINHLILCTKLRFRYEHKKLLHSRVSDVEKKNHIKEHNEFIDHLSEIKSGNRDDYVQINIFIDYFRHWIINHLLVTDRKLSDLGDDLLVAA